MRIAVLFNSGHPKYGGMGEWPIRASILRTDVIQRSERHVKIRIGDVLIFSHSRSTAHYEELAESVYFSQPWQLLDASALRNTYLRTTVYCWVIENIDEATARRLHVALLVDAGYLGMHAVDLTDAVHLALYRNSLVSAYRIKGRSCHMFFSSLMGKDGNDLSAPDELRRLGFKVVEWEDTGAHGTGFDDFDTLEHFERVEEFRSLVGLDPGGKDKADELVLMLEDLSPRLLTTLGACAHVFNLSAHEEYLAQAGVSARRYFEQLADALFPSRATPFKGRSVTHEKYKNRLWAYIDSSISDNDIAKGERLAALGKEVDRLIEEVNATLHGTPSKNRLSQALGDIAALSAALLQLNPEAARKPYFAFQTNIIHFIEEAARGMRSNE